MEGAVYKCQNLKCRRPLFKCIKTQEPRTVIANEDFIDLKTGEKPGRNSTLECPYCHKDIMYSEFCWADNWQRLI